MTIAYLTNVAFVPPNPVFWFQPEDGPVIKVVNPFKHKPYLLASTDYPDPRIVQSAEIVRRNLFLHKDLTVFKHIVRTPSDVWNPRANKGKGTGIRTLFENSWEDDVRYHENAMFDTLIWSMMMPYEMPTDPTGIPVMQGYENMTMKADAESFNKQWATMIQAPYPDLVSAGIDIEVKVPKGQPRMDAVNTPNPVDVVCFYEKGGNEVKMYPSDYKSEKVYMEAVWERICGYPMLASFMGDNFDVGGYFYNRSKKIGAKVPKDVYVARKTVTDEEGFLNVTEKVENVRLPNGILLDMWKFFASPPIRTNVYTKDGRPAYSAFPSLEELSELFLGQKKTISKDQLSELFDDPDELGRYCVNDARLHYELARFAFPLMTLIARISRLGMADVSRISVTKFGSGLFRSEFRKLRVLLPSRKELGERNPYGAEQEKFKGAIVGKFATGFQENVWVIDVGSLYPTMIANENIGYGSVNCPHPECRSNLVPQLESDQNVWLCKVDKDPYSLIIGSIKDQRLALKTGLKIPLPDWYKPYTKFFPLEKEVVGAFKVGMNGGGYGFVSSPRNKDFYFRQMGEAITAHSRNRLLSMFDVILGDKSAKLLYSDTDSAHIKDVTREQLEKLVSVMEERLDISIAIEEHLVWAIYHEAKNYIALSDNGHFKIAGLSGRKSNLPNFVRSCFDECLEVLKQVKNKSDLSVAKIAIEKIVLRYIDMVENGKIPLDDLALHIRITKNPGEGEGQAYAAYRYGLEHGLMYDPLAAFSYVLVKGDQSAKPVQLAKLDEVDVKKYLERIKSVIGEQLLDYLGIHYDTIEAGGSLDLFVSDSKGLSDQGYIAVQTGFGEPVGIRRKDCSICGAENKESSLVCIQCGMRME